MTNDPGDVDVTRRTRLAAERTWLAWWRTGIATATAAVAVGGVVPELVDSARTPYVVLGVAYAATAATLFLLAGRRQAHVEAALRRGGYAELDSRWVMVFSAAGVVLALATLALIIVAA